MAATNSSTATKAKNGKKNTSGRSTGVPKTKAEKEKIQQRKIEDVNEYKDRLAFENAVIFIVMIILAVFLYLSYFGLGGAIGKVFGGLFFGIFGWSAWILPVGIILGYAFVFANRGDRRVLRKLISFIVALWMLLGISDLLFKEEIISEYYTSNHVLHKNYFECMNLTFDNIINGGKGNAGILGRMISTIFAKIAGETAAIVIMIALFVLCLFIFYGVEMMAALRKRNAYKQTMEDTYREIINEQNYKEPSYRVMPSSTSKHQSLHTSNNIMQSVNLTEMNRVLDKIEENTHKKAFDKKVVDKSALEEVVTDNETDEILIKKSNNQDLESIPVFRDELNKKFGKKKNSAQKIVSQPLFPYKAEVEEESIDNASESDIEEIINIHNMHLINTDSKNNKGLSAQKKGYVFPWINLLNEPKLSSNGMTDDELRSIALKLQTTLKSFNVNVRIGAVTCGPTVTRYEFYPEQGVRVNKIKNLADDLKLSLAAKNIRIEAPIPGKSAIGIEVPNPEPSSVTFRELIESEAFQNAKSPITFAVGKDIRGNSIMTDIAKMPHLLIAGATGSGKSVCINTLIMSILYKANPDDVKLIMIDPKVVELGVYNGIPHLFCPVVTDPKEASTALNWAVHEMMDRYNKFKELGVRNITGYNKKIETVSISEKSGYAKMPSLVIIVDEFADLMMVASKEVEDSVCRLAQLARAAGIHLVLATQRPSVNVITGLIKANIPSRIAFSVSSAVDSRTIIDKSGAEKLIGKGDMLFFPSGYSEPIRVQGAFISDKEVSKVVEFLCAHNEAPTYNDNVTKMLEETIHNYADGGHHE